jgi:hypothetical protein
MKLLIDGLTTVNQIQKKLSSLEEKDVVICLVDCLSVHIDDKEIFQFLCNTLKDLPTKTIATNLVVIFELKKTHNQLVRDLVTEIFDKLTSKDLAANFIVLVELVRSNYFFVREEAMLVLNKIKANDLFNYFDAIVALRNDGDLDLRHMHKKLVVKIAKQWPIETIKSYASYVAELQKDNNPELKELGDLLMLRIMESWGFDYDRFKMLLPFFQKLNESANVEINEKAAWFAWRILSESSETDRLININYLTKFNDYGDKIIRRMYRTLALDTMELLDDYQLTSFSNFLIDCLECSNKDDRNKAWIFLLKINPDSLPLDYLINKCDSDFWFVKFKYRFLLKRISDQALAGQLEILFTSLRSVSRKIRNRSWRLLNSIQPVYLRKHQYYLESQANMKNVYISEAAKALLRL